MRYTWRAVQIPAPALGQLNDTEVECVKPTNKWCVKLYEHYYSMIIYILTLVRIIFFYSLALSLDFKMYATLPPSSIDCSHIYRRNPTSNTHPHTSHISKLTTSTAMDVESAPIKPLSFSSHPHHHRGEHTHAQTEIQSVCVHTYCVVGI